MTVAVERSQRERRLRVGTLAEEHAGGATCAAQDGEFMNARRHAATRAGIPYRVISDALNNQRIRFDLRIPQ